MNLCGIFYNVFDYLQNWLNLENLFISVALALGKMLRRSSVFVVFFFPFSAQKKTKPKGSRILLLPLLPVGSDFLRHRCHQEKDDFLVTQAFFALSSFILYQKQTALWAGECIGLVCWAQCLTAERPLVWQVFLLAEAFPTVKILIIPFPSVKQ